MTDACKNNDEQYLKIFTINKHSGIILSDDILPPEFHSIIFVISGPLNICIDKTCKIFLTSQLILIPNGILFKIPELVINNKLYIIAFSSDLLLNSNINVFKIRYHFLSAQNFIVISIKPEDIPFLKRIFKLIHTIQKTNNPKFQKDIFIFGLNFLAEKSTSFHIQIDVKYKHYESIILNFYKALRQNYKKEHHIKFYADTLSITSNYLSKIIKQFTGKTTKYFIDEVIITEAKILLCNTNLNISEIAEELQFSSDSAFTIFFKKHTSVSPTAYRSKPNN